MARKQKKEDQRIKTISSMVLASRRLLEIGADHGLISMALCQRKDIEEILATDISPYSLSKLAKVLQRPAVQKLEASHKIQLHVGDGLKNLPWDWAETIIICGMGGRLILSILKENLPFAKSCKQWILGPQSDFVMVRRFLMDEGLYFEERMAEEGKKFYLLLDVRPDRDFGETKLTGPFTSFEMDYGPELLRKKDPCLIRLLKRDQRKISDILENMKEQKALQEQRKNELLRRKQEIENYLQGGKE